ncbi:hypothetical protein [Oricola cellulosilytica]|uniref:Dynamin n=1 Tax=Oricola cellulosilytica TaxID=1429082 RepID=A0A4R0PEC0_9HYPH|nr:hypothetical protein [Oricola cellulosilytica]TCD15931.1 hypothetical protein E0D97_00370 [Oricola cellulosilytica]
MANHDHETRETTVVTSSGGGAGWFVAILLVLVLAFGAWYLFSAGTFSGGDSVNVTIDAPDAPAPEAPAPEAPAPAN